jgi:hypothetical protein
MRNNHKLVPCGKKIMNWPDLPSSDTYIDRNRNVVHMPSTNASGVHFYLLELDRENDCVVFRVGDTILHDAFALNWGNRPADERGMGPSGKLIDDKFASEILNEAIHVNPEQRDQLETYRGRIDV